MEFELLQQKAEVLIEALPCIQEYKNKIVVVKYGGSAMVDEQKKKNVIKDIALLKSVGFRPVIVHGGGKEINRWIDKVGMESRFVNGLRVTDEATMEIVEMVLSKVNKELVQLMENSGVKAAGISGKDGGTIKVTKKYSKGEDIGFVGEVTTVNNSLLNTLLDNDYIPVVCPIGTDKENKTYNINADDAACGVAKSLKAEKLVFLTDIAGVCTDPKDPSTVVSEMTIEEAKGFIEKGLAGGGMLPKLSNCIDAVETGVSRVHILDGRVEHSLLLEFFTDKGIGTMILENQKGVK
jgi:acetylglutamate kinase